MLENTKSNKHQKEIQMNLLPLEKVREKAAIRIKPRILLLGEKSKSLEVEGILEEMGVEVKRFQFAKDLKQEVLPTDLGVIYVAPLNRSEIVSVHKSFRAQKKLGGVSFYAVVPKEMSGFKERKMYQMGIKVIFEWPKDKLEFSELILKTLISTKERVQSSSADKSLLRAIKLRLKGHEGYNQSDVNIKTHGGMVLLFGNVSSLSIKNKIVNYIKEVPGVKNVSHDFLKVQDLEVSSKNIENALGLSVKGVAGLDSETINFVTHPEEKNVVVSGSLPTNRALKLLRTKISKVPGVKSVYFNVKVSEKAYQKDLALSKKAKILIDKISSSADKIKVKAHNGILTLNGKSTRKADLFYLKRALSNLKGVGKIQDFTSYSY